MPYIFYLVILTTFRRNQLGRATDRSSLDSSKTSSTLTHPFSPSLPRERPIYKVCVFNNSLHRFTSLLRMILSHLHHSGAPGIRCKHTLLPQIRSCPVREEEVDFFEGQVCCFWVKEVDDLDYTMSACVEMEVDKRRTGYGNRNGKDRRERKSVERKEYIKEDEEEGERK